VTRAGKLTEQQGKINFAGALAEQHGAGANIEARRAQRTGCRFFYTTSATHEKRDALIYKVGWPKFSEQAKLRGTQSTLPSGFFTPFSGNSQSKLTY